MVALGEPPVRLLLATLCVVIAIGATWRGAHLLGKGLRGAIVAVSMAALGGGVLLASKGLLVFGAIFLGEELYETGVVLLALRARAKAACA